MPNTIADNLRRLKATVPAIGNAIITKGGTVNAGDGLEEFPTDIMSIKNDLTSIDITENGTYYSGEKTVVTSSTFPVVVNDSNGTPVRHADVDGNTVQSSTPTPQNPVMLNGTGERTRNLAPPLTEWVDGYVASNGNIAAPSETYKEKSSDYILINAGKAYSFSMKNGFPGGENNSWRAIGWYAQDKTFISRASSNANVVLSTNAPSNAAYCRLSYRTYGETTNSILNEGSTALPYEPYGIKIPISSGGVNLWSFHPEQTISGVTLSWNGEKISYSGTCTSSQNFTMDIKLKAGTYTLKANANRNPVDNGYSCIDIYRASPLFMAVIQNNDAVEGSRTFTIDEDTDAILRIRIHVGVNYDGFEIRPMLNRGSTALPYEPYNRTTTPVYLGEVETTRRIRKLVLTGEENCTRSASSSSPNAYCYAFKYSDIGMTDIIYNDVNMAEIPYPQYVCSHFKMKPSPSLTQDDDFTNIQDGEIGANSIRRTATGAGITYNKYIILCTSQYTTITDFKSYLAQQYAAGTPVTVWYVLAEPETGVIVNEPLMKIGDYADSLSVDIELPLSQNAKNTIDINTTVKPSSASFTYNKLSDYIGYNEINVNVPIPTKYVTEITITENIIEDNMFKNYTALETAILPNTLTTIGIGSFENCTSLTLTTLPDTVTTINNNAFNNCTSLSLTTLPTSLITIGNNAFSGTAMAGEIHIPNTVTTIGDNIFSNTGITDIIFDGTPTTISSNAFSNINSLETIYVPWAEGTVTGAPWGAGSNVTILYVNTNWHDIREVVRKGKAQQFYPLGTVLYDDFDSTNTNRTAYEVVAYNHFNDSSLSAQGYVDSMTLCEKYVRYGVAVDAVEALMAVTTELPAGTYKFTIPNYDATYGGNKTYYFVLNNSVPVGGQLVLNWPYQAVPRTITTYASSTATTSIESYGTAASPLPEWVEGTSPEAIDLGTVTMSTTATTNTYGIFNHIHRARYGSNNYAQSGIRQYMNATTTNWWTPQTIFDRRHGLNSSTGILGTLNTDFVNVLATPSITNIANNTFEYQSLNGDTFTLNTEYTINTDKLFLLSHSEVNLSASPTLGTVLDYYIDADNTKRIKYDRTNNSTARYWWFRTPYPTGASYVRTCDTSGALGSYGANNGYGCVPACIIQ